MSLYHFVYAEFIGRRRLIGTALSRGDTVYAFL